MSVPLWTAAELAAATGGRGTGAWSVAGISIDSRTVEPGELFVALAGPHHDGHDFVADALRRGAAVMVHRTSAALPAQAPVVLVEDTFTALNALGTAGRARARGRVLAVTGSVGKTGTKEALRHVLAAQASIHASAASHNNHWGVPLSLARLPASAQVGVFEVGMNAPGEIARLSRLVRPHVALITNVEAAHIGFFASLEAIADAKAEVFQGLEPDGIAILNADSPHIGRLKVAARTAGCTDIVTFGAAADADARLISAQVGPDRSDVTMNLHGRTIAFRLGAPGRHWVQNSLAVLAAVAALGGEADAAAATLVSFAPSAGRGRRHDLPWGQGSISLIDESYNANPASMRAALDLLGHAGSRRIAVLGDMLELGEAAPDLHIDLAGPLERIGAALVFTAGPLMHRLHDALPAPVRGAHADRAEDLEDALVRALRPGDVVLVKGSLGSRMRTLVDLLLRVAAQDRPAAREGG